MIPRLLPGLLLLGSWLTAAAAQQPVIDDLGNTIRLEQAPRRIVTLAPHATELVVAAGAADRLVAVAAGLAGPPQLAHLPQLSGHGALDRETLLALRPDLVIGWQSGNRASDLDWIETAGIALYRSEPRDPADIAAAIRAIGRLAATTGAADIHAQAFEDALHTDCAALPLQAVYVEVWDRPAMSVGGGHWINGVLQRAGLRNALAHVDRGVLPIAPELVFRLRALPVVSLLRRFDGSPQDTLADHLSRPGPRLADAVRRLCELRRESGDDRWP